VSPASTAARRCPRLLPQAAVALCLVVMLTLTSAVSFAAWNATVTKNATASAGTVGISSSGFAALAHGYSASSVVKVAPVTVSNTGTVPLTLSSVAIGATGPLAPNLSLALWKAPSAGCQASVPTGSFTTTLSAASTAIPASFAFAVPATGLSLCAATTLTGSAASLAAQTVTPTITLTGSVGSHWAAADASTARSFTQTVQGVQPPTGLGCADGDGYPGWIFTFDSVLITWTAPAGAVSYKVYVATADGATLVGTTTSTRFEIDASVLRSVGRSMPVTVVAVNGAAESLPSAAVAITSSNSPFQLSRNVNCG
jgi:hypothetical protein